MVKMTILLHIFNYKKKKKKNDKSKKKKRKTGKHRLV